MDTLGLFRRYRDDVFRLAVNYTGSCREAEAVSQAVFLAAAENLPLPGKEWDYLMEQTAARCRSLHHFPWRRTSAEDEADSQPQDAWQIVMNLPARYRVVLYLRYYEDCTTEEIARFLKISQSAAAAWLSRGRALLERHQRKYCA